MVQFVISMGIDLGYGIGIVIWVGVKIVLGSCFEVEIKSGTTVSVISSDSNLNDSEANRFGSELYSLNASDTSTESSGRSMSNRTSNVQAFTFQELRSCTKCFSRSVRIGEGGFGCVYKGVIKSLEDPTKKIDVAVKQLGKKGLQGHKEWVTEVNVLGVVEHLNLVKLLGYCADDDEGGIQRLLVYEYMPNGSVEDHL
ncbi:Serine/threonine-protein kinase PCRK1-like protein [Drosera capensis]